MVAALPKLWLKPGREKSLRRRHPWVFSGAVERVDGKPDAGAIGRDRGGGRRASRSRAPTRRPRRSARAFGASRRTRASMPSSSAAASRAPSSRAAASGLLEPQAACRLVFSESDGLPGLIVDRYGDYLVCQFLVGGRGSVAGDDRRAARRALRAARHLRALGGRGAAQGRLAVAPRRAAGAEPPRELEVVAGDCSSSSISRTARRPAPISINRRNRERVAAHARDARRSRRVFVHGRLLDRVPARRRRRAPRCRLLGRSARARRARDGRQRRARPAAASSWPTCSTSCGPCARRARVSIWSCSIRRSSCTRPSSCLPAAAVTRTSTCSGCSSCGRAACSRRSRARATWTRRCSRRSSPAPPSTPAALHRYSSGSGQPPDHPVATEFPEGDYLKGLILRVH